MLLISRFPPNLSPEELQKHLKALDGIKIQVRLFNNIPVITKVFRYDRDNKNPRSKHKFNFDPSDYINVVVDLFNHLDEKEEAKIRTIFNRCYYASFQYFALKFGVNITSPYAHGRVYNKVKRRSRRFARHLDYIYAYRIAADYHLEKPAKVRGFSGITDKEAKECINRTQTIIKIK